MKLGTNGSRDTGEKVLCSSGKVPLFSYRSEPRLRRLERMCRASDGQILTAEAEMQPKVILVSK